ncbi:apolipoprotein N-acyltransferase [Roseibium litorale]|uniref:Apolipoprotein N-acyltransferase n=1 Tax=Roseibium litorale TaxID=2803841 RepID=A0ABR9CLY3_9HYPH|nr:apolipoprotein N-acyltransferase [Roseibium litorale]MBD8891875.1 apolipoprotein N-acyltransferase [Roseibium litorale]
MPFLRALALTLPNACLLAWGWRRWLCACAAGALSAAALPPLGWFPVLFVTLPALVWLLDGAVGAEASGRGRFRSGFVIGWWFGFGYFLAGLWWIGSAFLVDGDRFAWMMPLAVAAMPAGLALFPGLALSIAARVWPESGHRVVALAVVLTAADLVRGAVLTGFPWNSLGQTIGSNLVLAQTASITGMYGLGFLAVLIFAAPAVLIDEAPLRRRVRPVVCGLALLGAMAGFGLWRLEGQVPLADSGTDIRIVQPAIAQAEKWRPENRDAIFQEYIDLSERPLSGSGRVGHERILVWPESAVPFILSETPYALYRISQALDGKMNFVTGAIRVDRSGPKPVFYNSVYLFDPEGLVLDAYDKVHLVPFGEYLPLRSYLSAVGFEKLVDVPGSFEPGFRHKIMTLPDGTSFLPLICYEAIFPGYSGLGNGRPDFLLNVTNDAWFGLTPGPYQHLAQARLRSIEQGLPLVRAANTGISAVIDAKGRIRERLGLGMSGVLDAPLPAAGEVTIYARAGNVPLLLVLLLLGSWVLIRRLRAT